MIRMNSFETYRVCKDCFMDTFAKNPPTLEKYRYRDGKCKSCGREWVGINVGYYNPLRKWYTVRPRPFNSKLSMCRYKMGGNCYRDWRCRSAHNQLELEIWIEDDRLLMSRKRPGNPTGVEIHKQRDLCRVERRNGKYGGYRKDILKENLTDRDEVFLICGICKGIMREACVTSIGEQICSCCEVLNHSRQTPNEVVKKMVNSLKCSCPLLERGCEWIGTLKDCEKHLETCSYVRDQCKLACGAVLHRNKLRAHEAEKCPNRKVECEHCNQYFTFGDLTTHHKECPKIELSCELKCDVIMCREDMSQHMEHECAEKVIMCPFVKYSCEVSSIKRKYLSQHLEEKRTEHLELKLNAMEDILLKQSKEANQQRKYIDNQIIRINRMSEHINALCSISDTTKLDWNIENISKFIQINHIPERRNIAGCDISIHFLKEYIYVSYADTHEYGFTTFSAKYLIRLYSTIKCKVVKQYDCGKVDVYGMRFSREYEKKGIARILKSDAEELSRTGSANKLILEMYITEL